MKLPTTNAIPIKISEAQKDAICGEYGPLIDIRSQADGSIKPEGSETLQQAIDSDIRGLRKILGENKNITSDEHKALVSAFSDSAYLSVMGQETVTCGDVRKFMAEEVINRIKRAAEKNKGAVTLSREDKGFLTRVSDWEYLNRSLSSMPDHGIPLGKGKRGGVQQAARAPEPEEDIDCGAFLSVAGIVLPILGAYLIKTASTFGDVVRKGEKILAGEGVAGPLSEAELFFQERLLGGIVESNKLKRDIFEAGGSLAVFIGAGLLLCAIWGRFGAPNRAVQAPAANPLERGQAAAAQR